jgi:hypothetical protein
MKGTQPCETEKRIVKAEPLQIMKGTGDTKLLLNQFFFVWPQAIFENGLGFVGPNWALLVRMKGTQQYHNSQLTTNSNKREEYR